MKFFPPALSPNSEPFVFLTLFVLNFSLLSLFFFLLFAPDAKKHQDIKQNNSAVTFHIDSAGEDMSEIKNCSFSNIYVRHNMDLCFSTCEGTIRYSSGNGYK